MTIRVVIIDESSARRAILESRLASHAGISVIGTAANASEGRDLIRQLEPDVITLDLDLPGMNALNLLGNLMKLWPTAVIGVTRSARRDNAATAQAIALGAIDCYTVTDHPRSPALPDDGKLAHLVRQAARIGVAERWSERRRQARRKSDLMAGGAGLIAVGSSIGGVEALQILLRDFPADCPPTMIVQHINATLAPSVARTLDSACPAKVKLAEDGMALHSGHVYLAPGGDRHMTLGAFGGCIQLRHGPPVSGHRPSVDVLFKSVASTFGAQGIGILLSGMGSDGANGLLKMAETGARTIVQDEATCVIFGMPRAAIALGAAGVVAAIGTIARYTFANGNLFHGA